jgi:hypothetical protein
MTAGFRGMQHPRDSFRRRPIISLIRANQDGAIAVPTGKSSTIRSCGAVAAGRFIPRGCRRGS